MTRSVKAALLSAFVFPGVGHLYLKRYVPAALLFGSAFAALYYVISKALERALQIVAEIERGEVGSNTAAIVERVTSVTAGSEAQRLDTVTALLIAVWVVGIVHAYWTGRSRQPPSN